MTIGIDVVDVARFRRVLTRSPWLRRGLFQAEERAYCETKTDPDLHLAAIFAAKEAVAKAMGLTPLLAHVRRVSIGHDESGRPRCLVDGVPAPTTVSITHDTNVTVAAAIWLKGVADTVRDIPNGPVEVGERC